MRDPCGREQRCVVEPHGAWHPSTSCKACSYPVSHLESSLDPSRFVVVVAILILNAFASLALGEEVYASTMEKQKKTLAETRNDCLFISIEAPNMALSVDLRDVSRQECKCICDKISRNTVT